MGDRLVILMGGTADIIEAHKWSRLMFRHIHLQTETLLFNTATRWSTATRRACSITSASLQGTTNAQPEPLLSHQ